MRHSPLKETKLWQKWPFLLHFFIFGLARMPEAFRTVETGSVVSDRDDVTSCW